MAIAKKRRKASTTRRGTKGKRIRVAIIGVGNCASSLVQGVHYYRNAKPGERIPGIMHVDLGGYHIRDVDFVAAIDVDRNKVGKDLADAIYQAPNNTYRFADVPRTGVRVSRGMTHDGIGKYLSEIVKKAPGATDDIVGILRDREVDVVVSYLPVEAKRPRSGTSSRPSRRAAPSSTASRSSSRESRTGRGGSRRRTCRSSGTTSSRRSGQRSPIASSPGSSWTAACVSTAPTS
jgi:hypothetical protein